MYLVRECLLHAVHACRHLHVKASGCMAVVPSDVLAKEGGEVRLPDAVCLFGAEVGEEESVDACCCCSNQSRDDKEDGEIRDVFDNRVDVCTNGCGSVLKRKQTRHMYRPVGSNCPMASPNHTLHTGQLAP